MVTAPQGSLLRQLTCFIAFLKELFNIHKRDQNKLRVLPRLMDIHSFTRAVDIRIHTLLFDKKIYKCQSLTIVAIIIHVLFTMILTVTSFFFFFLGIKIYSHS